MNKQVILFRENGEIKMQGLPEVTEFLQVIDIDKLPDTAYQECWEFNAKGSLGINLDKVKASKLAQVTSSASLLLLSARESLNLQLAKENKVEAKKVATQIEALEDVATTAQKEMEKIKDFQELVKYMPDCLPLKASLTKT